MLAAMPLVDHARLPPGGSNHSPPHRRRSTSGPSRLRCLSGSTGPFRDTSARAEGLIDPSHPGGTAHALPSDRAGRPRLGAAPAGRRRPSHSRCVAPAGPVFVSSGSRDGRESEHRGHSAVEATDVAGAALPGRHSLTRSEGANHSPPHRPWSFRGPLLRLRFSTLPRLLEQPSEPPGCTSTPSSRTTAQALPSDRAGRPRLGSGPAARRRPPSSKHVATAGRFASLSGSPDTRKSQQLERRRSRRSSRGA